MGCRSGENNKCKKSEQENPSIENETGYEDSHKKSRGEIDFLAKAKT